MTDESSYARRMLRELESLRDRHPLIRGIGDSYVGSVVVLDAAGTIIYANKHASEMFGLPVEEFVGRRHNDEYWDLRAVDGRRIPLDERPFKRIVATQKKMASAIYSLRLSGGFSGFIRLGGAPIFDDAQRLIGVIMHTEDVTDEVGERLETERYWHWMDEALSGSELGVWSWELDTDAFEHNADFMREWGYDESENFGTMTEFSRIIHPDDLAPLAEAFQRHVKERSPRFSFEHRVLTKDGKWRWILSRGKVVVWDKENRPLRARGMHLDIDSTKRAGEALRREESRWRSVVASAGDFILLVDRDRRIRFINKMFSGMTVDEVIGHDVTEFTEPEQREVMERRVDKVFETGEGETYEVTVPLPDGRIGHFLARTSAVESDGEITNVAIISTDITSKRENELALRRSERTLRSILDNAPDFIVQVDRDLNVVFINRLMSGLLSEDVLGKPFEIWIAPEFRDQAVRKVRRVFETGEAQSYVCAMDDATSGKRYWFSTRLGAVADDGQIGTVTMISADITEQVRIDEERRRLEGHLRQQQKLESIGTLASGVAHEINNPIQGIMNYAELISIKLDSEGPISDYAQGIVHETHRVASIVRKLLAFARQEKEPYNSTRVADIINDTLALVRMVLRKSGIDLLVDVPEDLPTIRCRSQQIEQVLMNLVTNASDALNERYPDAHPDKRIEIGASCLKVEERPFVRITVRDFGVGVPPDIRERIFDPFYTTKGHHLGTGLGLSVSHGIIQEHGGSIHLESRAGEGACFSIDLPIDRVAGDEGLSDESISSSTVG
ncbi:MAG: PAS domain S-box protein [Deltaproteobacteria bacterium]|nr:PAS domain S-box protein [Deltaproteobacteria bacterium]